MLQLVSGNHSDYHKNIELFFPEKARYLFTSWSAPKLYERKFSMFVKLQEVGHFSRSETIKPKLVFCWVIVLSFTLSFI